MIDTVEKKYFEVAIPILADYLTPFTSQEINDQIDTLIDNIRDQNTGHRHVEESDKRYKILRNDRKRGKITEEEFETGVNDLAILQLEEKKTTRAHLIDLLTKTSRDKSKFSFLFDPLIYSNDNALQLFAKAVKKALYDANENTREFLYELQEQYREFIGSSGVSENNVERLNKQLVEEIVEYVRNQETGKMEAMTRVSFIQPYNIDLFRKNRKAAVEKASKESNYYTQQDFETEEDFNDYKENLENWEKNGKKVYRPNNQQTAYDLSRRAFNAKMRKWYQMNTSPVPGAIQIAKDHEKQIKGVLAQIVKLGRKISENKATPIEIEKYNVLEIELENLNRWKNQNYYYDK